MTSDDLRGGFWPDMTGGMCALCHIAVNRGEQPREDHATCLVIHQGMRVEARPAAAGEKAPQNDADPLTAITRALEECRVLTPAEQARHVLAAAQGLYVPPPPGSDRDALPEHLRALIAPWMRSYQSTYCETGIACTRASGDHLEHADELLDWAQREHASCRLSRKQDLAACNCTCHTESD